MATATLDIQEAAPTEPDVEIVEAPRLPPAPPPTPATEVESLTAELAALDHALRNDEAEFGAAELDHAAARDLQSAREAESRVALVAARLRRRRGERVDLVARLEAARIAARDAEREPHLAEMRRLADDVLPSAVRDDEDAIAALIRAKRSLADCLHAIGVAAAKGGHARAGELKHPSADELQRGEPGAAAVVFAAIGGLFEGVSPAVRDERRILGPDALDRLAVSVRAIVHHGGAS